MCNFRLAWSGKHDKAFGALRWLRGNNAQAHEELDDITEHLQQENHIERNEMESIWEICTRLPVLKPLIIICVFQMLGFILYTYTNVITSVVSHTESTDFSNLDEKIYTAIGILILLMIASRRLVFISFGVIAAANIFFYGLYLKYLIHGANVNTDYIVKSIVTLVYHSSCTAFDMAVLLVIAELLPGRVRGSVSAYIFALFFLIANCLSSIYTPPILELWPILTAPEIFAILSIVTMAATGLIYMWLPETKGKTLTDIEDACKTHQWFYDKRRSDRKAVNIVEDGKN